MQAWATGRFAGAKTGWLFVAGICAASCLGSFAAIAGPAYPLGIGCVNTINLNSSFITIDSFDSGDTNYSDWNTNLGYGTYDAAKRKANGNVGTDSSVANAISVQNAKIYGHVDTGPGGTISLGVNGSVGSLSWVPASGIQPGYASDDMNVTFSIVTFPTGLGNPTLFNGSLITSSGYYQMNTVGNLAIQGSGSAPINVTIWMPNGFSYSGSSGNGLTIGTNANVTLYVGQPSGPSASITTSGNGSINNLTQNALNLQIYALPSVTSISLLSNAGFTGTIYAPEANFSFGGGGVNTADFIGALVVNSAIFNSHVGFHFDENLSRISLRTFSFTGQPTNRVVQPGTNITFSVSTTGGSPMNYQWFFNQTNLLYSGTHSYLSLSNVQMTNAGCYSVIVTNLVCALTSTTASLIIYTDATPTLGAACVPTNGQFQFNIAGVTGLNYAVQISTDLMNWVPLATNTSPFVFTDTNFTPPPPRFYRAVFVP